MLANVPAEHYDRFAFPLNIHEPATVQGSCYHPNYRTLGNGQKESLAVRVQNGQRGSSQPVPLSEHQATTRLTHDFYSDLLPGFRSVIEGTESNECVFEADKEITNGAMQTKSSKRDKLPEGLRTSTIRLKSAAIATNAADQKYFLAWITCRTTTMAPIHTTNPSRSW